MASHLMIAAGLVLCLGAVYSGLSPALAEAAPINVLIDMMTEAAEKICQTSPLEQTSNGVELSGEAKANLDGIIKKFLDAGVKGAAKYDNNYSKGVLQKDLSTSIKDGNACRLEVF